MPQKKAVNLFSGIIKCLVSHSQIFINWFNFTESPTDEKGLCVAEEAWDWTLNALVLFTSITALCSGIEFVFLFLRFSMFLWFLGQSRHEQNWLTHRHQVIHRWLCLCLRSQKKTLNPISSTSNQRPYRYVVNIEKVEFVYRCWRPNQKIILTATVAYALEGCDDLSTKLLTLLLLSNTPNRSMEWRNIVGRRNLVLDVNTNWWNQFKSPPFCICVFLDLNSNAKWTMPKDIGALIKQCHNT